jgi:hypothetical protein
MMSSLTNGSASMETPRNRLWVKQRAVPLVASIGRLPYIDAQQ